MKFILNFLLIICLTSSSQAKPTRDNKEEIKGKIWCAAFNWIHSNNDSIKKEKSKRPIINCSSPEEFGKSLKDARDDGLDKYKFYDRIYSDVANEDRLNLFSNSELIMHITNATSGDDSRRKTLQAVLEGQFGYSTEGKLSANNGLIESNSKENTGVSVIPASTVTAERIIKNKASAYSGITPLFLALASLGISIFCLFLILKHRQNEKGSEERVFGSSRMRRTEAFPSDTEAVLYPRLKSIEDRLNKVEANLINPISIPSNSKPIEIVTTLQDVEKAKHEPILKEKQIGKIINKYAHLPEEEWIKSKDVLEDQNTSAFIELTINGLKPEEANFRINPESNHKLAINNSGERLKIFFDFKRSYEVVNKIINVEDGKLAKTSQGWKIEKKAKIRFE